MINALDDAQLQTAAGLKALVKVYTSETLYSAFRAKFTCGRFQEIQKYLHGMVNGLNNHRNLSYSATSDPIYRGMAANGRYFSKQDYKLDQIG